MANEQRLIDANDALEVLCGCCDVQGCCPPGKCYEYQKISKLPTVDAVEVVRCKDCKHGIYDEDEQMWECIVEVDFTGDLDTYSMFHEYNDLDHFCSYGERKDDGS